MIESFWNKKKFYNVPYKHTRAKLAQKKRKIF